MSSLARSTETLAAHRTRAERRLGLSARLRPGRVYRLGVEGLSHLPLPAAYAGARRLGRLRARQLRHLLRVNPELVRALDATPAEVEALVRRSSELRASGELDVCLLQRADGERVRELLRVEGLRNLESALRRGRGAVLYSGHIRSLPLVCAALAELGHPPTIVSFRPPDAHRTAAERFGYRYLYMGDDLGVAVKAARVLKEDGVVLMLIDKPQRRNSLKLEWLGGRRAFGSGPALLAHECGAPLLDFYSSRDDAWFPQVVEIGEPHEAAVGIESTAQECVRRFERQVLQHPAQWDFLCSYEGHDGVDASRPYVPG